MTMFNPDAQASYNIFDMTKQLTKQSSEAEIKSYFAQVLNLTRCNEAFPVNLDDVWPLVYAQKDKAVRSLQSNELFIQGVDYQVLTQNGENSDDFSPEMGKNRWRGRPANIYMLSVPCLEFFIARRVRPVFEVYRQVFHKVASGAMNTTTAMPPTPANMDATLMPLARYNNMIADRFATVLNMSQGNREIRSVAASCLRAYESYRMMVANLVFLESVAKIEGANALA